MSIKQRAVNPDQKEERRQIILDVALQLFQAANYEAVSMVAVAEAAQIAKGTVYLYFKTKEALFLALLTQEFERWFDRVETELRTKAQTLAIDSFGAFMVETLIAHPALVRLIAILHVILEQNIDFATALQFKEMLLRRVNQTGPLIESALPFLRPGEGMQLLLRIHALVIGLQHMAEPAPLIRAVLAEPHLALFRVDFHSEFFRFLQTLLTGLAARDERTEATIPV